MTREEKLARRALCKEMFDAGATDEEIGKALGIKVTGVEALRGRMRLVRPLYQLPPNEKVDADYLRREFAERIAKPYAAGKHEEVSRQVRIVAQDAGVDPHTVRRRLRSLGLMEKDTRNEPKSPEDWARAEELLRDGMPYGVVAREVGIERSTLTHKLPGLGVRPEDVGAYRQALALEEKVMT